MTREEAIWWVNHLFEIQKEEYFNKRMMEDAKEVEEAQHMAIDALKCEPIVIRCKELLSKEDFEAVVKRIHEQNQNVIVIPCEAEVVSTNTPTNTSTKSTNISTDASADRPRGEWTPCEERLPGEKKAVLICDSRGNRFVGKLVLTDHGYKWSVPLFKISKVWVDIEDGDAWMPLPEPYKESDTK